MNAIVGWFARNPVAANILMALLVVGGIATLPSIRVEVFPEFSADVVAVSVPYPGAAPEEVDEAIVVRVIEEVQDVDDIEEVTATATEGIGAVTIKVRPGADARKVLDDVKARVDAIDSFPDDAEEPVITELVPRAQVINVAVSGEADERSLKELAERVRAELLALPEITQVVVSAARPYEVSVEVSEAALRRFGLSLDDVAGALRRAAIDVPGGGVKTEGGEVLLRAKGKVYSGEEIAELPLVTRPGGGRLLIGDVARVDDGFQDNDLLARFDGEPVVLLQVFRVGDENAIELAEATKAYVRRANARMPAGVTLTTWRDDSRYLSGRINTLLTNGWQGLVLVFLVLMLFLRPRLSFWVTLGIPISFLGTVLLMPTLDVSVNVLSLFAFIVVLGIVVDDAIVVGESVYKRIQRGEDAETATVEGTQEVAVPVVFAVLTSVAAFVPLAILPGFTGRIWRVIPLVVIPTLLFSIIESQWILPAHLRHVSADEPRSRFGRAFLRVQSVFAGGLERFVDAVYRPVLAGALRLRYFTLSLGFAAIALTAGLIGMGALEFSFFPKLPADDVAVAIEMPAGTPAVVTERAVAQAEKVAMDLASEEESSIVEHMMATVGEQPYKIAQSQNAGMSADAVSAAHLGEVHVALVPNEEREGRTSDEFVNAWRERVGEIPGAVSVEFTSELMGAGKPIDIQLKAFDLDVLRAAAEDLKNALAGFDGVYGITDSYRLGKREATFRVTETAEAMGLSQASLGRQVRQAFYGEEALRFPRGREEVKVMVRYPMSDRRSLGSLDDLRIRRDDGGEIPFHIAADVEWARGLASIQRADMQRKINVTADVDTSIANANEINGKVLESVLPEIESKYQGLSASFEGERKEQTETLGGLFSGLILSMFAIYGLMAIPFKSYWQPVIVMTAIPFGIVGAFWGHLIVGITANVLSMCGMLALAGIVVNDNLVLVHAINREKRERGKDVFDAVMAGGTSRFRPILLTSLTTFAGLTPLMLEKELQAQFLIPMAVSLAFGVMFATFVSLLLVPALYVILEDLKRIGRRASGRGAR